MKYKLLCFVMALLFVGCDNTPNIEEKEGPLGRELRYSFTTDGEEGIHMEVYLPTEASNMGIAIIDCPGGAYYKYGGEFESTYWAKQFNSIGCAYAVLYYSFPKGDPAVPRHDIDRAVGIFLENSVNWGIDKRKIGVMGFSAGGHLASTVATHPSGAWKPGFQILFYPVITMGTGTHSGSRTNFLGNHPSDEDIMRYSSELFVSSQTPKAFITYAKSETVVPPTSNGKAFYNAMINEGADAKLLELEGTKHGWHHGNADHERLYLQPMKEQLTPWLQNL